MGTEDKKRRRRRNRGRFAGLFVVLLIVIYTPALLKWFFTQKPETAVIKHDVLELKTTVEGVFIRQEMLLKAPGKGILMPEIQYGERVANGGIIASFVKNDMIELVRQYRSAERDILARVVADPGAIDPTTRRTWDESIERQMSSLVVAVNSGNMQDLRTSREVVNSVLEDRARVLLESGTEKNYLKQEKQELSQLKMRMESSVQTISAVHPGVVSYAVDGFEETLTPDIRQTITGEDITKLVENTDHVKSRFTPAEVAVEQNAVIGKVIQNAEAWYVFTATGSGADELKRRWAKALEAKTSLKMQLKLAGYDATIPIHVESVRDDTNGVVIVAKLTRYVELLMEERKAKAELILYREEGMRVPVSALINRNSVDNTADLVLVKMDKASFRRIQVLGEQDGWAVVENLKQSESGQVVSVFDIYLVNPENTLEGQVIAR